MSRECTKQLCLPHIQHKLPFCYHLILFHSFLWTQSVVELIANSGCSHHLVQLLSIFTFVQPDQHCQLEQKIFAVCLQPQFRSTLQGSPWPLWLWPTLQTGVLQYNRLSKYSLHSTVQYSTVQYSTVQYSTVQYSTVQYSTVQYTIAYRLGYTTPYSSLYRLHYTLHSTLSVPSSSK